MDKYNNRRLRRVAFAFTGGGGGVAVAQLSHEIPSNKNDNIMKMICHIDCYPPA